MEIFFTFAIKLSNALYYCRRWQAAGCSMELYAMPSLNTLQLCTLILHNIFFICHTHILPPIAHLKSCQKYKKKGKCQRKFAGCNKNPTTIFATTRWDIVVLSKANPKAKHGAAAAADWRLVPVKSMLDEMMRFLQIGCDPNKGERKKSNLALST